MSLRSLSILTRTFKALRGVLVALVFIAIAIPLVVLAVMSTDWAQQKLRNVANTELTSLLGTDVNIGYAKFMSFTRLTIGDVSVDDDNGQPALDIDRVEARYEIWDLLFGGKIIVDYASIHGLNLTLYKQTQGSPLNIDGIIRRLSKKDNDDEQKTFRLRLNDVKLSDCSVCYDVLDAAEQPDRFDPNHVYVSDINLNIFAPVISNDTYRVWLRYLNCREQSGIEVHDVSAQCAILPDRLEVGNLHVELPSSEIRIGSISVPLADGLRSLADIARDDMIPISILEGSHVSLPDLAPFVPAVTHLDYNFDVVMDASASRDAVVVDQLMLSEDNGAVTVSLTGGAKDIDTGNPTFDNVRFQVSTHQTVVNKVIDHTPWTLSQQLVDILYGLGNTDITGHVDGSLHDAHVDAHFDSAIGAAQLTGTIQRPVDNGTYIVDATASVDSLALDLMLPEQGLGRITASADVNGRIVGKAFDGEVNAEISQVWYRGYNYQNINANASVSNNDVLARLSANDPNLMVDASGSLTHDHDYRVVTADVDVHRFRPDTLHLTDKYPGHSLSGTIDLDAHFSDVDNLDVTLLLSDLAFENSKKEGVHLARFAMDVNNMTDNPYIRVSSGILNGELTGPFRLSKLPKAFHAIADRILPALSQSMPADTALYHGADLYGNDFTYTFTLSNTRELTTFLKLPVSLIGEAVITGWMSDTDDSMAVNVSMPWIRQGNNVIQNTFVDAKCYAADARATVYATSLIPTKKGDMTFDLNVLTTDGKINTDIDWRIQRAIPINGKMAFTTLLSRDADNKMMTQVNFMPGSIHFGDETWNIQPSTIVYGGDRLRADNFALSTDTQRILIDGEAGKEPYDRLTVELTNIELINIFETLEIDKALIGGRATGRIEAKGLLGKTPDIGCDHLRVKNIGYNYCTIGDADVRLALEDGGLFTFAADIVDADNRQSYLDGFIRIPDEYLDLNIKADLVPVGFMQPYMQAFTSSVSGYASGDAHLFGTFKDIDLTGDIYAKDLKIKIDFTNTWYTANDSIHIRPGIIKLDNVLLHDESMNEAILNGWVRHKYFHEASFDFAVTDARNFLCYDVPPSPEDIWYGKIYCNGVASIKGEPGVVDIGANVSTAPNSTFTFVLSDQLEASEYSFITFRDKTPVDVSEDVQLSTIPEELEQLRHAQTQEVEMPTAYNMDLNVDIRPEAVVVLVMDPIGGDSIRCNGTGHMRMTYGSTNNDLKLYGTYTLDHGNYNFTLQDIIIKDFIIDKDSSIRFNGDPYAAVLDIKAYYQVNANLSDLDESFLQDRELNRTNVPVRAMLYVTGDMRQPDIAFDLQFPTLTDDIYRKVRSIVSTEDMMNRQIIYLLALNRFYTPDYMASTTKGNELFSVASSTISSQLSSMLGKLSENWSISPNLRSDRGDFSDIEVDVSLSSSLLNNRLLFNGNFGYRDKSLNTNQFIGDFDIEYKLDKPGHWRIKGYNRYNDQNYYLRAAQTTQGVGIMYNTDFDRSLRFIDKLFHRRKTDAPVDTVPPPQKDK